MNVNNGPFNLEYRANFIYESFIQCFFLYARYSSEMKRFQDEVIRRIGFNMASNMKSSIFNKFNNI